MTTVTNEKEAYQAMKKSKPGETIYFMPGTYDLGKYINKLKRIMKLSYRKDKSQRKRR
jgi:hypothetical protein